MAKLWAVLFDDDFFPEFTELSKVVQDELLARANVLEQLGPNLSRPYADTLKGSKYRNMKELRFSADQGVWRVAYAIDPRQSAVLLVAGDKTGISQAVFYRRLIDKADRRYARHLKALAEPKEPDDKPKDKKGR